MDSLIINNLAIATQIGVHSWEHRIKQTLLIDIHIDSDFSQCEDSLEKTIDYDSLCQKVTTHVESNAFQLIERVANEVAELIRKEFKVKGLRVTVSKPQAIKNAGPIQVVVNR